MYQRRTESPRHISKKAWLESVRVLFPKQFSSLEKSNIHLFPSRYEGISVISCREYFSMSYIFPVIQILHDTLYIQPININLTWHSSPFTILFQQFFKLSSIIYSNLTFFSACIFCLLSLIYQSIISCNTVTTISYHNHMLAYWNQPVVNMYFIPSLSIHNLFSSSYKFILFFIYLIKCTSIMLLLNFSVVKRDSRKAHFSSSAHILQLYLCP